MLVGDAMRRRKDDMNTNDLAYRSTSFRCFGDGTVGDGTPGYGNADSFGFPSKPCVDGIRSNIYFPR